MKERRFESVSVVCPFYKHETKGSIACRGFMEDSSTKITFGDPALRVGYRRAYCESEGCDLCRIYRMLEAEGREARVLQKITKKAN